MTSAIARAVPESASVDDLPEQSEEGVETANESPSDQPASRSFRGLSGLDLFVLGAILLWPCAYLPFFANQAWTPRVMTLIIALPVGLLALYRLARHSGRAAAFGAAAIGWAILSAAVSANPLLSFKGVVATNSSVLIYAGAIAIWAVSRFMSDKGRGAAAIVFVIACALNLVVGMVQVMFRIDSTSVSLVGDRAVGLIGNSMIFGAIVAAGGALCAERLASLDGPIHRSWWSLGVLGFALGATISGSRVAMVALLVVGIATVVGRPVVRASATVSLIVGGFLAGSALTRVSGGGRDSLSRLSESGGTSGRTTVWRTSLDAVAERPITGWGLGRFRSSVQSRFSLDELIETPLLPQFADAHNVFVELAVLVGVPGLILFLAFGWLAGRESNRLFRAAAATMFVTWLLQPTSYHTLPLALVLLGAGARSPSDESGDRLRLDGSRRMPTSTVLIIVGLVPALVLGIADVGFKNALWSRDYEAARTMADFFAGDPVVLNTAAAVAARSAATDPGAADVMFDTLERAVEVEPERARWWKELAAAHGLSGNPEAARLAADRAIELEPFDEGAWRVVWVASTELGDDQRRIEAARLLCEYGFEPACEEL